MIQKKSPTGGEVPELCLNFHKPTIVNSGSLTIVSTSLSRVRILAIILLFVFSETFSLKRLNITKAGVKYQRGLSIVFSFSCQFSSWIFISLLGFLLSVLLLHLQNNIDQAVIRNNLPPGAQELLLAHLIWLFCCWKGMLNLSDNRANVEKSPQDI